MRRCVAALTLPMALAACAGAARARPAAAEASGCGTTELQAAASDLGVLAVEWLPDQEIVEREEEVARVETPCAAAEGVEDCRVRVRRDALEVLRESAGLRWRVEIEETDEGVVAQFRVGRETLEGRFASFEEIAARMRDEQARGISVVLVRAERMRRAGRALAVATRPAQTQRDVGTGALLRWRAARSAPGLSEVGRAARAAGVILRSFEESDGQRSAVLRCSP